MNEYTRSNKDYIGYEYKEVIAPRDKVSIYLDAYQSFGWIPDDTAYSVGYGGVGNISTARNIPTARNIGKVQIKLKRDRKIINKAELTRLQRNFEACMDAIAELEKSKTTAAIIASLAVGIVGTAFMAGSVFAITATPPIIWLCILLAIPGIIGWALPYFVYKKLLASKTEAANILIEQKYDEIYEVCEKGSKLL